MTAKTRTTPKKQRKAKPGVAPAAPADQAAGQAGTPVVAQSPAGHADGATEATGAAPTDPTRAGAPAAKPKKGRQPKQPEGRGKKPSALDAAARVLAGAGEPMTCQELIEAMAKKRYWTSPAGKTPHATLYAAILREIQAKGTGARFAKAAPGKFARAGAA